MVRPPQIACESVLFFSELSFCHPVTGLEVGAETLKLCKKVALIYSKHLILEMRELRSSNGKALAIFLLLSLFSWDDRSKFS